MSKKQDILFNRRALRVAIKMKHFLYKKGQWRKGDNSDLVSIYTRFIEYTKIQVPIDLTGKRQYKEWAVDLYVNGGIEGISKVDNSFYGSPEWKELRAKVISHYGEACMKCGDRYGGVHVDHIKPRSKYPELQLEFDNMQVLCLVCNVVKSNRRYDDYRPQAVVLKPVAVPNKVEMKRQKDLSYYCKGMSKRDKELQKRYDKLREQRPS